MKEVIEKLTSKNCTISTMESCTGGALVSEITDIEGASEVLKYSAVTYSNEYKIKMGVSSVVIDKYSVYSKETAIEMAQNISKFANSDYGIGITGKLNRVDKFNSFGEDNKVFICIFDKNKDKNYILEITVKESSRHENKKVVIKSVVNKLLEII
ncbi:MAG: nicotinamide-nucleotide amidohydrolase family protein [Clostridium sp.]|nr:nicotinamide-nucleotide amidohydrolase family protein [Clostridium sp.]MCM1444435.1 nicotinamide-nucleotide amidohydrolase family protein [Candidatus Amulumruptor caecigallinarius]